MSQAVLGKFVWLCCASVSPSVKWLATLPEPWGTGLLQCCQPGEEFGVQQGCRLAHTGAPRLMLQPLWGNPVGIILGGGWKQVSPSVCSHPGFLCWVRNSPGLSSDILSPSPVPRGQGGFWEPPASSCRRWGTGPDSPLEDHQKGRGMQRGGCCTQIQLPGCKK